MQAIYDYVGIVETVCELQTFASGFTKRDLVLTDDNDVQTKYPNHIAFTFKKDNTALLNNVQIVRIPTPRFFLGVSFFPPFSPPFLMCTICALIAQKKEYRPLCGSNWLSSF